MNIFLGTLLLAVALFHNSFGYRPRKFDLTVQQPIESVIKQYALDCSIKDIDTDISKEKSELVDAFGEVEMKINGENNNQPNMSRLLNRVEEECRSNEKLNLLSQKLVKKAEDCIVSSNLKTQESEIQQELIKRVCDAISSLLDWKTKNASP